MPIRPLVAVLCLLAAGCTEDRRLEPTAGRDLTRPDDPRPITIPLAPRSLATQADFDAFEKEFLTRMSRQRIIQVYAELARDAAPASREADAILLQRLTLLQLSISEGTARLQEAFKWADELRAKAPNSPHTLFLLAHIKRILLMVGSDDGTYRITTTNRDIASRLRDDWRGLVAEHPDYRGPNDVEIPEVKEQLAALDAALAAWDKRTQVTPPAGDPPQGEKGSDTMVRARRDLWRFEHDRDVERQTLCDDRVAEEATGGETELERRMDLACATQQGDGATALRLLGALAGHLEPGERCRWIARVVDRMRTNRALIPDDVAAALQTCATGSRTP